MSSTVSAAHLVFRSTASGFTLCSLLHWLRSHRMAASRPPSQLKTRARHLFGSMSPTPCEKADLLEHLLWYLSSNPSSLWPPPSLRVGQGYIIPWGWLWWSSQQKKDSITHIFKWLGIFSLFLCWRKSFFCVFPTVFGGPCWPKQSYTGLCHSHFCLLFENWMRCPCLCRVNGSFWFCTNLKQISRLMKLIFSAFLSARSPAPLSLLRGSWRISPA